MQSTGTAPLPSAARERQWSLAAAIASVTVFGLSIGQGSPLMSLLLESRGSDATLNGLNAGASFAGVIVGPLLAPICVRLLGVRNFLLLCFGADIALFMAMKPFHSVPDWFALRLLMGLIGSSIFTSSEAWINQLAGDVGRGRILGIYAAALAAGFGIGPLVLSLTGIQGWPPFLANAAITALAALPLLGVGETSRSFGRERGASPLTMFRRAPLILGAVTIFAMYEAAMMTLLPIWGVWIGLDDRLAAATLSAVFFGSIVLQVLIGWLSDRFSRIATLRLCGAVGLLGALALASVDASLPMLLRSAVRVGRHRVGDLSRCAQHGRRPVPRHGAGHRQCRDDHRLRTGRAGRTSTRRRGDGCLERARPVLAVCPAVRRSAVGDPVYRRSATAAR